MIYRHLYLIFTAALLPLAVQAAPLRALIIDGQSHRAHKVWPKSTIMMCQYLEETGLFEVDIARTKYLTHSTEEAEWLPLAGVDEGVEVEKARTDPDFKPAFAEYDVVISNFGGQAAPWPKETQAAFEAYMRNGGGFVSVHAADNNFPEWKEYNRIIGIGGWQGRNEEHGPYLYVNKLGEVVRDNTPGPGGKHGPRKDFLITMYDRDHPISKGLPKKWMHADDECYAYLRGPAEEVSILATGLSEKSKRDEPMLMTIRYHKGRTFHTTLGHHTPGFECVGFITTFKRGTEWAATGKVTQTEVPDDFPSAEATSSRPFKLVRKF